MNIGKLIFVAMPPWLVVAAYPTALLLLGFAFAVLAVIAPKLGVLSWLCAGAFVLASVLLFRMVPFRMRMYRAAARYSRSSSIDPAILARFAGGACLRLQTRHVLMVGGQYDLWPLVKKEVRSSSARFARHPHPEIELALNFTAADLEPSKGR